MLYGSIIAILGWITGWFLLWRTGVCRVSPAERKSPSGGGHVSVIVPARNEEERLPPLLASLAAQSVPPGEIIVVDDGSTDGTAALARESGARVVAPGPLPAGWLGKPWACHRGTQAARGNVFVFLDADTRLEEDGLERLLAVQARKGGLLSVQPYHEVKRPYEHLSAFFNLIVPASTAAFTPFGDAVAPKASFGPCIVCSRADYAAAGGHRSVRGEVLENLALGRRFQASGLPLVCRAGRGTVAFRMYPEGMGSLVRGWSKSFASGARTTAPPVLLAVVLWLAGGASAGIRLGETLVTAAISAGPGLPLLIAALIYAAYALQITVLLRRTGNFHPLTGLLYPVPLLFFFGLFGWSAVLTFLRKQVSWKGRDISVTKNRGAS
ncbi:glycosyltransferase family 2 protein [Paenibacillus sp. UNC499MF]|uniref:glycosyltransferase n=1 Tax=Paenibacillus sp. UNC499MF TaxID=1502751 RepID=UPI0008A01EE3|nr:glycosyltransferase [Paenibacillus sp. UNC499MF]SEG39045.1 4,4'-diaponeurosporenoate glycosyltransferase [Paenibacillus sp. UNC499MF]